MKYRGLLSVMGLAAVGAFAAQAQEAKSQAEDFKIKINPFETIIVNPSQSTIDGLFPLLDEESNLEEDALEYITGFRDANGMEVANTEIAPFAVTLTCSMNSFDADINNSPARVSFSATDNKVAINMGAFLHVIDLEGLKPGSTYKHTRDAIVDWKVARLDALHMVRYNLDAYQFTAWGCGARFLNIDPKQGKIDVFSETQNFGMKISTLSEVADIIRNNPRKPVVIDQRRPTGPQ